MYVLPLQKGNLNLVKISMKNTFIIFLYFAITPYLLCSQSDVIKTREFYSDNKLRREILFDSNLKLLSEIYYRHELSTPIAKIIYTDSEDFKEIRFFNEDGKTEINFIDFIKGEYSDFSTNTYLKFKENFIFDGKQIGENIISFYKNGKRNGQIVQYDSTISGKLLTNKIFLSYEYAFINGKAIIVGIDKSPIYDDNYKLFKGINGHFKDDLLNGNFIANYSNGKHKIISKFQNGICVDYTSFDNNGNTISKINCTNGLINPRAIINGSIQEFKGQNIIWFKSLFNTGKISSTFNFKTKSNENNILNEYFNDDKMWGDIAIMDLNNKEQKWRTGQIKKFKEIFDKKLHFVDNQVMLRILFGIPYFYINRFDFDNYDNDDYYITHFEKPVKIDSNKIIPYTINIDKKDKIYYERTIFGPQNKLNFETKYFDYIPIGYERKPEYINDFKDWLKSAYNYNQNKETDYLLGCVRPNYDFESINNNDTIVSIINNYTSALISNCKTLWEKKNLNDENVKIPFKEINFSCGISKKSFSNRFECSTLDSLYKFSLKNYNLYGSKNNLEFSLLDIKYNVEYILKISYLDFSETINNKLNGAKWEYQIRDNISFKNISGNLNNPESTFFDSNLSNSLIGITDYFK